MAVEGRQQDTSTPDSSEQDVSPEAETPVAEPIELAKAALLGLTQQYNQMGVMLKSFATILTVLEYDLQEKSSVPRVKIMSQKEFKKLKKAGKGG